MPNSSIKNEKTYEDPRRKGGQSGSYYDWSVGDLKRRAKELGMSGYSKLTKDKLIWKLRSH